jgi:hypothetical protein
MKVIIRTLAVCGFLGFCGTVAYSCTCRQISHRKEFRLVDAVFSGQVISIAEDKSFVPPKVSATHQKQIDSTKRYIVHVGLEDRFKGVQGKTVDFYAYQSESPCAGMIFDQGERWLIYAYRKPEGLTDGGLCSRTKLLDKTSPEYKELRSLRFRAR